MNRILTDGFRQKQMRKAGRGEKRIMTWTMYFNMLLNIGLLVLLATLLTNMPAVRKLFRGENNTTIQKMALAVIF